MTATDGLLTSPLHDRHLALGATLGAFGGWSMPLSYPDGTVAEHRAVREAVGIFDVSHLGKLAITGAGAAEFVNRCLTADLAKIGPGHAQYTLCCTDSGGVVDDIIVYLGGPDDVLAVPNAANAGRVADLLRAAVPDGVTITDRHLDLAVLAVQGPRAAEVLAAVLGGPAELSDLDYMAFVEMAAVEMAAVETAAVEMAAVETAAVETAAVETAAVDAAAVGTIAPDTDRIRVCRTGYTGERGYELLVPAGAAPAVWDALLAAAGPLGGRPAGLGARDTLRTEMGYPLHGQDLSVDISPVQAGSGWAVGWSKPAFWGREALVAEKEAGPGRRLRGLRGTGRGVPRAGMAVLRDGERVGVTTSGTFSPTLRTGIALALIDTAAGVGPDDAVTVDVRGRSLDCVVTRTPFVPSHVR